MLVCEPMLHFALGAGRRLRRSGAGAIHLCADNPDVNVLVADDALQHYALMRMSVEVISAERRCGNNLLLPAGPLREPREPARNCELRIAIMDDAELRLQGRQPSCRRGAS